jgi:hypothetical protein
LQKVFWFNSTCENQIALQFQKGRYAPSRLIGHLEEDLSILPLFYSSEKDILLVHQIPTKSFCEQLQKIGIRFPHFVEFKSISDLKNKKNTLEAIPWGWSEETAIFAKKHFHFQQEIPYNLEFFSKIVSHQWLDEFIHLPDSKKLEFQDNFLGKVVSDVDEVEPAIAPFFKDGFSKVVFKAPHGTSGQNQLQVSDKVLSDREKAWCVNTLKRQKQILIEPWFDKILDFSFQFMIHHDDVQFIDFTCFKTSSRGQFLGNWVGSFHEVLPDYLQSFQAEFHELAEELRQYIKTKTVGQKMNTHWGVDGFIYQDKDEIKIRPIVEVNPRYTMGAISISLKQYLAKGIKGSWRILNLKEVKSWGFSSFVDFVLFLEKEYSLEIGFDGLLKKGILCTNDPQQAQSFLSCLFVGDSIHFLNEMKIK